VIFFAAYVMTRFVLIVIFNAMPGNTYADLSTIPAYVDMRAVHNSIYKVFIGCCIT